MVHDAFGDPNAFPCCLCGVEGWTMQWAYDHKDPNELTGRNGVYSLDIDHYMPLCRPCHRRFDDTFIPPYRHRRAKKA